MSFIKDAKLLADLVSARVQNKRVPLIVTFTVTRRCNLRCSYCFVVQKSEEEMDTNSCKGMIREFVEIGMRKLIITGGEPLIREDIDEIISFANSQKISLWVNSNGYFVPTKIAALKKIDKLLLTLDGDKETHDRLRGQGSYVKVIDAIEAAKSNRVPVNIGMVVTSKNIDKLQEYFKLLAYYKIEGRVNILFENMNKASYDHTIACEKGENEEIKEILIKITEYKRKGYPIIYSPTTLKYCLRWKDYNKEWYDAPPEFPYPKCYAGKLYCFVNCNGDMHPCCLRYDAVLPVNGLKLGFKNAFDLLPIPKCFACYNLPYTSLNLICNLDVVSILDLAWSSIFSKFRTSNSRY